MVRLPRRWVRVLGYALMCAAGVAAMVWPAPSVKAATSPTSGLLVYIWALLLAVGGASSAAGSATDRWLGEYAGLLPLIATFGVYGLAALLTGRPVAVAGGLAFLAIACIFAGRWRDVALVRMEAARVAGRRKR